jgi:predicted phosphodiesterase
MKAAWLTDIHLDHLGGRLDEVLSDLGKTDVDCFLVTGDIAQAPSITVCLQKMESELGRDIYFVLGNHDYYFGSVAEVNDCVRSACRKSDRLHWLGGTGAVRISTGTALAGCDSWGDCRLGNVRGSGVVLNDFRLIKELAGLGRDARLKKLRALGDEAAAHLRKAVVEALSIADHVAVLTHVPPFAEAAWHEGNPSHADWLPYFACKAVGDVLADVMQANPDKRMTVLCGHTHSSGVAQILPNLTVCTGAADYGRPEVQRVFEWV